MKYIVVDADYLSTGLRDVDRNSIDSSQLELYFLPVVLFLVLISFICYRKEIIKGSFSGVMKLELTKLGLFSFLLGGYVIFKMLIG